MAKSEWASQYKHPSWQKKRLEALELHGFECENCGDKETTLHVHHRKYIKGRKVWEYDADELEVLCEPCHEEAHAMKDLITETIALHGLPELRPIANLLRGYARGWIGPFLDDEIAASSNPGHIYVGILADWLICEIDGGQPTDIASRIFLLAAEDLRSSRPAAVGLIEEFEAAARIPGVRG